MLFINELKHKCYAPPYQFSFQQGLGYCNALTAIAKAIVGADNSDETLVLAGHDVRWAYYSLVHATILLLAAKQVVNTSVISALRDIYSRLKIPLQLPPDKFTPSVSCNKLADVCKDARQKAVSSLNFSTITS